MKRFLRIALWIAAAAIGLLLLGFGYVWINEWVPADQELIYTHPGTPPPLPDTLTVLTWNTGYAGLGDDMDFFMDGGKRTRTSRQRTQENLGRITEFLQACGADIILLQEVDRDSRRSYHTDQFVHYREALAGYHGYFALNYKSPFVPLPLRHPMGKVESGVAIFSRIPAEQVVRHQYRSEFAFPVRLFNLKRCWLAAGFHSARGSRIWIGATHNTAYDTGNMRDTETVQLYDQLGQPASPQESVIVGGDWNQTPPGYIPSSGETDNPWFSPQPLARNDLFAYAYDRSTPSVRYLYEPLSPETTTSTIDFFLTRGFSVREVKTIDLGFRNSDHNPVLATFVFDDDNL